MLVTKNGRATVVIRDFDAFVNEQPVGLTSLERRFIGSVAKGEGKVRTPRMLLNDLYSSSNEPELKIFDVICCKIRFKLEEAHADAVLVLRRVWGRGFAFGTPSKAQASAAINGLPAPGERWVPNRKRAVIDGLRRGTFDAQQLFLCHDDLSQAELDEWTSVFARHGHSGLRVTKTRSYAMA